MTTGISLSQRKQQVSLSLLIENYSGKGFHCILHFIFPEARRILNTCSILDGRGNISQLFVGEYYHPVVFGIWVENRRSHIVVVVRKELTWYAYLKDECGLNIRLGMKTCGVVKKLFWF